jgi:hypothetical protein
MKFIIENIIIFLIVLVLLINCSDSEKSKRKKYCHLNEVINCWESLRYFSARVNGTGIVVNENEFDYSCRYLDFLLPLKAILIKKYLYTYKIVKTQLQTKINFCQIE